jgi:hypothetical protein
MNEYDMTDEELMQLMAAKKRGGMPEGGMPEEEGGMGLGGMAAAGAGVLGAGLAMTPMGRPLRGLIGRGADAVAQPFGPMMDKAGEMAAPMMQKMGDMAAPAMQGMGNFAQDAGNALRGADEASGGFVGRGAENASAIASAVGAPFKSAMQGGKDALAYNEFARKGAPDAVDPFAFSMPALKQNFGDTMDMAKNAMGSFRDKANEGVPTPNFMKPAYDGVRVAPEGELRTNPTPAYMEKWANEGFMPDSNGNVNIINKDTDISALRTANQPQPAPIDPGKDVNPWKTPPNAATLPEPAAPPAGPTLEMPTEGTPFNPNVRGTEMPIPPALPGRAPSLADDLAETFTSSRELNRDMRNSLLDNARAGGLDDRRLGALKSAVDKVSRPDDRDLPGSSWVKAAKDSFGQAFKGRSNAEKKLGKAYMESAGLVSSVGAIKPESLADALSAVNAALRGGGNAV